MSEYILHPRPGIVRVVDDREVLDSTWSICASLGEMFRHAVIEDDKGIWRWDPNELIGYLFPCDQLNHENLLIACKDGKFMPHELVKLLMQQGLCLTEFLNLFDGVYATSFAKLKDTEPEESVLRYLLRTVQGHDLYI